MSSGSSGPPKKTSGGRECVVCNWSETTPDKTKGPLLKPCQCPEDKGYYHYRCVAEVMMSSYDAPCRGCDQQYTDSRIERHRGQYYQFVISSHKALGILALWVMSVAILTYLTQKKHGAGTMWLLAMLAIITLLLGLVMRYIYMHWMMGQDRKIWFSQWTGRNITGEYNLTQSKKLGRKVFAMFE